MGAGGEENVQAGSGDGESLVPVTLLCGFLGSGKTTLLKHILESKHTEKEFKCAVIVNDMAELNIDKALIDQTSLIQSDEAMVGMQNGCICCTLQSDLVEQIIKLTQKKQFNYILIEASGVSEPHEIAPLFELDDHDHEHGDDEDADHEGHDHSKPQLGEVARLDTCVTLIDSADFYNNLGSMKTYDECDVVGTIAELMMDQVEFANVILLNKGDLVNEEQQGDIREKISLLNPKAKILKSIHSKIDVMEILNTKLYKDKDEFWVTSTKTAQAMQEREERGGGPEACTARFDIKSFVYRARKPFHPGRLNDLLLEPFFMDPWVTLDLDDEEEGKEVERTEEEQKKLEELKQKELEKVQEEAMVKQKKRTELMGELLRSKGFLWMATAHDVIGGWQQAGNVLRIEPENPWMCLVPDMWRGTTSEAAVLEDINQPSGEEWEFQDRRQEIVFIGHGIKTAAIQDLLDQCLLTQEEMALGPEQWKETVQHLDNINLVLEKDEGEEEEEEEEEEDEEDEEDEEGTECEKVLGKRKKAEEDEECRKRCEEKRMKEAKNNSK